MKKYQTPEDIKSRIFWRKIRLSLQSIKYIYRVLNNPEFNGRSFGRISKEEIPILTRFFKRRGFKTKIVHISGSDKFVITVCV